jgi:hypothetical protein
LLERDEKSKHLVLMFAWEVGGIPSQWIEKMLLNFKKIWSCSFWVKQLLTLNGVPESLIEVVEGVVDPEPFVPLSWPQKHQKVENMKNR